MLGLAKLSTRVPKRLLRGGDGHGAGPKFNEPGGYLFGRKPGEKYEEEGWEKIWIGGFTIAFGLAALGVYYKPDTRVRTWARAEAERQMREEEDLLEYKKTEYRA
ncbi:hypothetical protein GGI20_004833 [Coemansia sp. BCRC 34301]|nr:hypothetical protein GGI20_004833 [Coemansia sp. BCRC 34301]